jgi:hypothetical protein
MVPQNSHGQPPRAFSPEVEEQLVRALSALTRAKQTEPDEALKCALEAAGREAKERELHPEELILTFKRVEHRIEPLGVGDDTQRVNLRTKLIRLLLEAYFSAR